MGLCSSWVMLYWRRSVNVHSTHIVAKCSNVTSSWNQYIRRATCFDSNRSRCGRSAPLMYIPVVHTVPPFVSVGTHIFVFLISPAVSPFSLGVTISNPSACSSVIRVVRASLSTSCAICAWQTTSGCSPFIGDFQIKDPLRIAVH